MSRDLCASFLQELQWAEWDSRAGAAKTGFRCAFPFVWVWVFFCFRVRRFVVAGAGHQRVSMTGTQWGFSGGSSFFFFSFFALV